MAKSFIVLLVVSVYAFVSTNLFVSFRVLDACVRWGPVTEASTIRLTAITIWILVNHFVVAGVVSPRTSRARRVSVYAFHRPYSVFGRDGRPLKMTNARREPFW